MTKRVVISKENGEQVEGILLKKEKHTTTVLVGKQKLQVPNDQVEIAGEVPSTLNSDIRSLDPEVHEDQWIVVQLSPQGEQEMNQRLIYNEVRRQIGDCEVFYPWIEARQGYDNHTVLLDGYIFIRDNRDRPYGNLSQSNLFEGPISKNKGKRPEWTKMSSAEIEKLKKRLLEKMGNNFSVGAYVYVEDGPYEKMTGQVVAVNRLVTVEFTLRSKSFTVDLEARVLRGL